MKVLIIGAGGMLGTDLVEEFGGHEVTGVDRGDVDIRSAGKVNELLRQEKPEVVINAAAFTDVDGAEGAEKMVFAINGEGVKNVATAARLCGAIIVHYSTDYVFPGDRQEGYAEDDEPGPAVNVYGESKLAGEKFLTASGARFYLLRTAWLYGRNGKNFVETMLKLGAQAQGKPLRVVNDQHGSPTFTKDLAKATRELLEESYAPGIYHAINSGVATWYDFAREIFSQAGMDVAVEPVPSSEYPRPAKRPRYSVLKNTRGPVLRDWREALGDYLSKRV